jgi:hypothetical protein
VDFKERTWFKLQSFGRHRQLGFSRDAPQKGSTEDRLVEAADTALDGAKNLGRNQFCISDNNENAASGAKGADLRATQTDGLEHSGVTLR